MPCICCLLSSSQSGLVELRGAADLELNAGDILLLEVGEGFTKANEQNPAFGLLSDVPRSAPLKTRLMWPAVALTAAMIATQVIMLYSNHNKYCNYS